MKYTPQKIASDLITFSVEVKICPKCKKDMVSKPVDQYFRKNTFPNWKENDFEAQALRAKLVFQSDIKVDDEYICEECKKNGFIDFLCALCKKRKPISKEIERFGDPPECLCKDCYNKVPASEWDKKIEELEEDHKYDFE